MASVDSVDVTIFGRSGHGAKPHTTASLHSASFAPDRERTIRTTTSVLVLSTLELLGGR